MTSVSPDSSSIADTYTGRAVPWSQEAEQAVLGAMLLDQDAALLATELVQDDMFYREGHRRLFRAMVGLVEQRTVIDPVTLRDELGRRGELDAIGGADYLADLVDAVPTAANLEYHARIVKDKAILRRLIEASTGIITEAYDGRSTASDLLDKAESRIFQISEQRGNEGFSRLKEMLWPTMERIEALQRSGKSITGVPSGFVDLDELTSGFQPSELVIVAARPSMGKTAFCLNMATHAAVEGQRSGHLLARNVARPAGAADADAPRRGSTASGCARAACATPTSPTWPVRRVSCRVARSGSTTRRASRCSKCAARQGGSRRKTTSSWWSWTTCS